MSPDPGVGSSTIPKQKPLKIKQEKQTRKKFKNGLDPKVDPHFIIIPQQSFEFRDTVTEPTANTGLCFLFANVR